LDRENRNLDRENLFGWIEKTDTLALKKTFLFCRGKTLFWAEKRPQAHIKLNNRKNWLYRENRYSGAEEDFFSFAVVKLLLG